MSRAKGNIAEDKACSFLLENGYSIVERNYYSRFGEIDIIAYKDEVVYFVEVKSAIDYELAVQNITPRKLSRLIKTADTYIKKNAIKRLYQYDAILITPNNIEHLQNITL